MSSQAQRFAQVVLDAFAEFGHTTDELVHRAGGPSSTYMTGLRKASEDGQMKEPRSDTYRRIEAAAGWRRGSAKRVWEGGEPERPSMSHTVISGDEPPRFVAVPPERGPRTRRYTPDLDGYVARLFDRVLDLEERVDHLEAQQREERGFGDNTAATIHAEDSSADDVQVGPDLRIAAHPVKGRESRGRRARREMDDAGEEPQD